VLFCDLVGSTEIAAQLDPEDWRELMAGYHRAAGEAITRYGGYVAQYLGDGVMAYFGWPEAHENDAERAARAGLAILEEVSKLNQESRFPTVLVRVGIDSGAVVVGAGAGEHTDVFGEAPNIAARVQNAAASNTVLLTASTQRLVSGRFVLEECGVQQLKGVANPVELYRVLRPTGVRGRLAAARGLTPFVGREDELRLLLSRWERVREGEIQLVIVAGEAGIGKSRLVAEFHDRIRDTRHIWIETAGEQLFENTPFHAVTELLSQWLQLQAGTSAGDEIRHLERALASVGLKLDETAPLIADLLQLPVGERYPELTFTPEQKRRRLLTTLAEWVFGAARLQPVVMVVEDLHWLDPSTLELQQMLAEQGTTARLMLLYTARPEFRAQWTIRPHHAQITLNRLSARDVRQMVALVAARHTLASESINAVIERTGGVPLFVEELTRAVLETGTGKITEREIPVTLQDSLMARLDRLGTAKEVAQLAATIGREFSYELLRAIYPSDETRLISALNRLVEAELLDQNFSQPLNYSFRHALIRDAAYHSLLLRQRRQYHRKLAEVLQKVFTESVNARPELLASHLTEAGLIEQAIPYWQQAGQGALERSANAEAISLFSIGLELLKKLPESAERDAQELQLYLGYLPALNVSRNWSAAETGAAYERTRQLCERLGETSRIFRVLLGLSVFHQGRGELQRAYEIALQVHDLASRPNQRSLKLSANWVLGVTLYYLGELVGAHEHLAEGVAFGDSEDGASKGRHNARIDCLSVDAEVMWMLGYPDRSRTIGAEAVALAKKFGRPYDLALALTHAHMLSFFRGDYEEAIGFADEGLKLCATKNFGFLETALAWSRDCTRIHMGAEHDIEIPRRALAAYNEFGTNLHMPVNYMFLARCFGNLGRPDLGLASIERAFPLIEITSQRNWEPETWRVQGDLILQRFILHPGRAAERSQAETEAEECTRNAIEIARRQKSKLFELRATVSLARLLRDTKRRDEARTMLSETYGWFTEGFATADLREAKALLDQLSRSSVGAF
jgi:class 3 adenylate cyclase/tetratricopeptide (TPR) repeat protein